MAHNLAELFPEKELKNIFTALEHNLDVYAKQAGGLNLLVPMA